MLFRMPEAVFLGNEPSQAPVIDDLLAAAKALHAAGVTDGTVSARYGKRTIVSPAGVPLDMLGGRSFVEVVDYDPNQDRILIIGEMAPSRDAPLHAVVYRAKAEVGALAQARGVDVAAPAAAKGRSPLESSLAVLEAMRESDVVAVPDAGVLAVGPRAIDAAALLTAKSGA